MAGARHVTAIALTALSVTAAVVAAAGCAGARPAVHVPAAPPGPAARGVASAAVAPAAVAPPPAAALGNRSYTTVAERPEYRVGPGDELSVVVRFLGDVEREAVTVRADGTIETLYGTLAVDGLPVQEIEALLRERARAFVRDPRVAVTVTRYRSRTVTLLGAIGPDGRGGVIALEGRTTLLQLLARAGALGPGAQLDRVLLHRAGGERLTVNLYALLTQGDLRHDPVLDDGDTVYVPGAIETEARRVFVLGEVQKPGAYPYYPGVTVSHLVATAGGLSEVAVPESIRVVRGGPRAAALLGADFRRVLHGGDRSGDLGLEPGDIVYVPRSRIGDWNAFLGKIRPTLDILTLPLQPIIQYEILRQIRD